MGALSLRDKLMFENAFYGVKLLRELWQYFGLTRVRAGALGLTTDSDGRPLEVQ